MKTILFLASFGIILSITTLAFAVEEITVNEHSSSGFKITKVMTNPKRLNALGKMAQFGDSNAVGKYTELSTDLPSEEQGEEFIINWEYTGTAEIPSLTLRLEYVTGKNTEIRIYEKTYAIVKPGMYEVVLKNIGKAYESNGEIAHWRVNLTVKDKVFAYRESRMWSAYEVFAQKTKVKTTDSAK